MKKMLQFALLVTMAALLTACASPQYRSGDVTVDKKETGELADAGGWSPKAAAQYALVQHPRVNSGVIPVEAIRESQFMGAHCQTEIGKQMAPAYMNPFSAQAAAKAKGDCVEKLYEFSKVHFDPQHRLNGSFVIPMQGGKAFGDALPTVSDATAASLKKANEAFAKKQVDDAAKKKEAEKISAACDTCKKATETAAKKDKK
ncbi:MAG: hypothetical protein JWN18_267 [Parcubacteria group bacterium]|nr:hypothetical protein [Parcubacteria group bacterium]